MLFRVLCIAVLSFIVRSMFLSQALQTSDSSGVPFSIISNSSLWNIVGWRYGCIGPLLQLFSYRMSLLFGIFIDEVTWRGPIFTFSVLTVLLIPCLLRRLGYPKDICLLAAAIFAILPFHLDSVRILHFFGVYSFLFSILAVYYLKLWGSEPLPSLRNLSLIFVALSILSHIYVMPLLLFYPICFCYFNRLDIAGRIKNFMRPASFFVLILPFWYVLKALRYALFKENPNFGFYLYDYAKIIIDMLGVPLFIVCLIACFLALRNIRQMKDFEVALLAACVCYLVPLFFMVPVESTIPRNYLYSGLSYFVLLTIVFVNSLSPTLPSACLKFAFVLCFAIYVVDYAVNVPLKLSEQRRNYFSFVRFSLRGLPYDVGIKAGAVLIQNYLPKSSSVLCLHRSLEHSSVKYYFGMRGNIRGHRGWSHKEAYEYFNSNSQNYSFVVGDAVQGRFIQRNKNFVEIAKVVDTGAVRLVLFCNKTLESRCSALGSFDAKELNERFNPLLYDGLIADKT
jgi:hypothetical protein